MTTLYGIKNCDNIRKARRWLKEHHIEYRFHDVREDGLDKKRLTSWLQQQDWEVLVNRRGTSWRQLPQAARDNISGKSALSLMLDQPTLIKRPVLEHNKKVYVGFTPADYEAIFQLAAAT